MAKQRPPTKPAAAPVPGGVAGVVPPAGMARELGPPGAVQAAERVMNAALADAQDAAPEGDHHAVFTILAEIAKQDAMVGGAIIFLHLSYTLEAIYRHQIQPN